jgi:cephalosporin-C deacetylase-like acetyl esterase
VAYLYTHLYTDAIRELERARQMDAQALFPLGYLGFAYGKVGNEPAAAAAVATLTQISETRYVPPYLFAVASIGRGANDEAVRWLQRAYEVRDDNLATFHVDSLFDEVRRDSRIKSLLGQLRVS